MPRAAAQRAAACLETLARARLAQALIEHEGEVFAIDATCYHMGGPLLHADIEDLGDFGPAIVCPWHRYQISLRNGDGLYVNMARQTCSKGARQRVHAAERRDGQIFLRVSHGKSESGADKVESDTYAFKRPAPSGGAQHAPHGRSGQVLARCGAAGTRGPLPGGLGAGCSAIGDGGGPAGSVASDVARSMAGADGRAPWARGPAVGPAPPSGKNGVLGAVSCFRLPGFARGAASASPGGTADGADRWTRCTVLARAEEGRATVQLSVRGELPGADPAVWERGAHLSVRVAAGGNERPYTPFVLTNRPGQFELLVKAYPHGRVSPHLAALKPGAELFVHGPMSGSAGVRAETTVLALVAGGTGITPLLQLLLPLVARAAAQRAPLLPVRLLCFNRTEPDMLLRDELERLGAAHPQLRVVHCLTRPPAGWAGLAGRPSAQLLARAALLPAPQAQAFFCGPPPFNDAVRDALAELGWTAGAIHEFS